MKTQSKSAAIKAAGKNGSFYRNGKLYIVKDADQESTKDAAQENTYDAVLTVPVYEGEADDLTALKGIGAKTAEKLNELGIISFEQLASLDEGSQAALNIVLGTVGNPAKKFSDRAKELLTD